MVSAGSYILSALAIAALGLSLGFSAFRLRVRLIPGWNGSPARLVESIFGVSLLIWLAELLGLFGFLYAWSLVASSLLLAAGLGWGLRSRSGQDREPRNGGDGEASPAGGVGLGGSRTPSPAAPSQTRDRTRGPGLLIVLITVGVVALVFAHWGLVAKDALDRGIFNFDSLWYHMPFAADIAQSHSVTGLHYTETVFTNWFYPQNSELLHAVGILLAERDTLSLFLNFGWLGIAFLAAWCIGRPWGQGPLAVVAAAVVLECHTLVVREPGAAKNDLMAAALLLAAIAILINAWVRGRATGPEPDVSPGTGEQSTVSIPPGWPLAAAGLAAGLAVGTKSTAVAMAAALTVAVIALAPAGRRWAATGWWFAAGLAGGGFWYLRNLIVAGNPLPQLESLGPISLPHPDRLQTGRPDFSIAHYATDTGVWRDYFAPGLEQAFGALWPLVICGAIAGALLALLQRRERVLRWMGGVVLLGMLAYVVTPLSAAGAEGAPVGFGINIRYAIPALLAGLALLPLAPVFRSAGSRTSPEGAGDPARWPWAAWALLAALLAVLVITDRSDAVLRDPARFFGLLVAVVGILIPVALLVAVGRGRSRKMLAAGFTLLALAVAAIGYPLQRGYLDDRFAAGSEIPGMDLDSAYGWAEGVESSRIGLAGTTAGFLQYGFYGPDLSNQVLYLGEKGPHGAFNAIPSCREFRAAVNAAQLDYLVTSPFLNFIHPEKPIPSPESRWLRGEDSAKPLDRSGAVTVWRVTGPLDPAACGPANAPLREVPDTPAG